MLKYKIRELVGMVVKVPVPFVVRSTIPLAIVTLRLCGSIPVVMEAALFGAIILEMKRIIS